MLLQVPSGMHSLKMKSPGPNMNPVSQEKLALDPIRLPLLSNRPPFSGAFNSGHTAAAWMEREES